MALDRLIPNSSTPGTISGDDFMDAVQEEISGLWNRSICTLTDVGGASNAITATLAPALTTGLSDGMAFWLKPGATNSASVTIAINGATAVAITDIAGDPLLGGELITGRKYLLVADGGDLRIVAGGASDSARLQVKRWTASGTFSNVVGTVQRDAGTDIVSVAGRWLKFTPIVAKADGYAGSPSGAPEYTIGIYIDTDASPSALIAQGSAITSADGPSLASTSGCFLVEVPDGAQHNYNFGIVRIEDTDAQRDFDYEIDFLVEEITID